MSLRIRQFVFAVRDLEATVAQVADLLRLQVCYRDPEVGRFGLENALLPIGDQFLELVAPTSPETAAGRHLARHGGDSAYMLILQTDDIEGDRARLGRLGVRTIWHANRQTVRASQIHPKDIGATIVSLDQPTPPEDWPWAGPHWRQSRSSGGAQRILSATVGAIDPAAMAQRWAEVLRTETPVATADGYRVGIRSGQLHFVENAIDRIVELELAVPDDQAVLAEADRMGLPIVGAATVQLCQTRLRLVRA